MGVLTEQTWLEALNWVGQKDGHSCGPLTLAAVTTLIQGRLPHRSFFGKVVHLGHDAATLLRMSQLLDFCALLMAEDGVRYQDVLDGISDENLKRAIETACLRVKFLN